MTTETGKIGYLGPLINDETRRLAASAFLALATAGQTTAARAQRTCSSR